MNNGEKNIVKYHDVALELENRQSTRRGFITGIKLFIIGLAKKVLIANTMGAVSDGFVSVRTACLMHGRTLRTCSG